MKITLQQNKWYGDKPTEISLPDGWDVEYLAMPGDKEPVLTKEQVRERIEQPYGSEPLSQMARGKKRVGIIFDDITRPTPTKVMAEAVLDILLDAGVRKEDIIFICALGTHGAHTREQFVKKLGEDIVGEYFVYNHNCYENLVSLGKTERGFEVFINKEVMACDLKVGIGGMIPHACNGYSGGYKLLFPGVAGIDTMEYVHIKGSEAMLTVENPTIRNTMGHLHEHGMRFEIEEMGRMAGQFFKVDCIYNSLAEPIGIYAGDPVEEYYEAVKMAKRVYGVPLPKNKDVMIVNANVKSNECNIAYGVGLAGFPEGEGGDLVIVNFAKSGQIPHYMIGHFGRETKGRLCTGMPDPRPWGKTIYYSPYPDRSAIDELGIPMDRYVWAKTWEDVLANLSHHGEGTRAAVLADATIMYYLLEEEER